MFTQEKTRNAWDKIAVGYDEFVTPSHKDISEEALRLAGLRADMKFLDVAAGTGALSIPAARLGARVLATDISPVMIERLNAHAQEEGLANLEGCVMDGHSLDLENDTFDLSGSQYGVMLLPNMPRALGEMVRVTRPGGRVMIISFGSPSEVEFLGFFLRAMKTVVPDFAGLPMNPPPLPFQLANPEKLHQAMDHAGLRDISVETLIQELEFQSAQELWDWVTHSNPIGAGFVADLTESQCLDVRQVLDDMLRKRSVDGNPAVLTNPVNIGIGTK